MINKSDIKVGVFVLFGLVLAVLVIFLIGDERRYFNSSVEYRADFNEVEGLKRGAPVNMGGVRIGQVQAVSYSEAQDDDKVHVLLSIVESEAIRIRTGSIVRIEAKGLLGDKQVTIASGKGDQLAHGGLIPSEDPGDMFGKIDEMAGKAGKAIDNVSIITEKLADDKLHRDLRESMASMNVVLKQLSEGDGYPHRFLSDKQEADRISHTIDSLDTSAQELTLTLREVRLAVARVRSGPGFAHDVLYGDGPKKEIGQVGMAAEELALTLRGVREGDGFAHDVLFGGKGDTKDAMSNITQLTADLRDIVRGVKEGKGTVGALLVDPSIYEDMKRVLGNVERNAVLRALVRYSIKKDKKPPKVDVSPAE
jgi:phospholipid/cholesterol/gamma-HCH transport system substrate-binding protein